MRISERGLDLIKHYEGLSLEPYTCPGGYPTIGYGHKIKPGENYTRISKDQAEDLLIKDLTDAEQVIYLSVLPDTELTQAQYDALVSFVYNVGGRPFMESTLRKKLLDKDRDNEKAAGEFGRWIFSNGKPLRGLIKRRAAEALLFINHS